MLPVWQQNITGQGVVVAILDDGVEHTHPDIAPNYVSTEGTPPTHPPYWGNFPISAQDLNYRIKYLQNIFTSRNSTHFKITSSKLTLLLQDAYASWDFIDNDNDSRPISSSKDDNNHGTRSIKSSIICLYIIIVTELSLIVLMYRCAGEVAAAKNNFCGVGVAYNARIAGTALTSVFKYNPPPPQYSPSVDRLRPPP